MAWDIPDDKALEQLEIVPEKWYGGLLGSPKQALIDIAGFYLTTGGPYI